MNSLASRLSALVDTVQDGVIQIDCNGLITLFNPACERMFGYRAAEVLGQNVKILMPAPFHSAHDTYLDNYKKSGERKIIGIGREVVGKRKDGSTFPMHLSVGEALDGDSPVYVGIVVDITDRKLAEAALRERAVQLRTVVDTVVDGVILIDASGVIRMFNPACERLFGYAATEAIGQNVKMLMPASFQAHHDAYLANYQSTGERKIIGIGREVVGQKKDGSTFPMELSVGEARQDGAPIFVGIIHDITERKRHETQRELLIEELARSNEERGHFAYVASHDLQQHLRMMTAFSGLLSTQYADKLDDRGREFLRLLRDGADRMQALIDDLLVFGRLGADTETTSQVATSDIVSALARALLVDDALAQPVIRIKALPEINVNPVRFSRLMQNLLANAAKYVEAGTTPEIDVWADPGPSGWTFHVRDNGIGIDPAYQEKIFEPFKRLHADAAFSGSGLGLSICRKIVEEFGGVISVRSEPGAGSTFSFTLPQEEMHQ